MLTDARKRVIAIETQVLVIEIIQKHGGYHSGGLPFEMASLDMFFWEDDEESGRVAGCSYRGIRVCSEGSSGPELLDLWLAKAKTELAVMRALGERA